MHLGKRVFYGWWVLAICSVLHTLGGGLHFYGFTVFFLPVSQDLGISRAATSLIFSLSRAEGAFEGPVAGFLIDRYGPRLVLILGTLLAGIGYVVLSQVNSYLAFLLVYLAIISVGFGTAFQHGTMAAVNNWFVRKRALAMAIVISAVGLGGALLPPLLSIGVEELGWRTTVFLGGLILLFVTAPLSLLVPRSPESKGLLPDGDPTARDETNPGVAASPPVACEPQFTAGQAMRTFTYWHLTLATTLRVGVQGSVIVHFVPIMVWKGQDQESAALYLSAMALLGIPVRLGLGFLGDRCPKPAIVASAMVLGVVALAGMSLAKDPWYLVAFVLLLGVAEAASPVNWAMLGEFFGRKCFGTLRGVMCLVYSWGMVVGPVFAGAMYDGLQSYAEVLWVFAAVFLLAAISFALLKVPKAASTPGRA
ncbi:MAG: MFS transporter [Chloroflexi bacterium]|nr:MFS transporter [Chloroflexota bacterium]